MTTHEQGPEGPTAEQYRELIERTSDVITVLNEEGTITYQSPSSEYVKGWSPEELHGENVLDYVHPDDRSRVVERFSALTDETGIVGDEIEFRFRTKDGGWVWLAVTGTAPGPSSSIEGYITTSREITERKASERRLERYGQLVENVPVGIYRTTPGETGTFVEVNPAMVEMFDADSAEDLLDREVRELYADPEDRTEFSERLEREGIVREAELELETLAGETFWASVTAIRSTDDGETVFDGVVQDITRRKEFERRLVEQRNDLETLNQVVRHDIRNDLQLIEAYAEMLDGHVDEEGTEYLETISESVDSAVSLTRTARDLAEVMLRSDTEPRPIAVSQVLGEQLETIRSTHPDAVVTVDGSLPETDVLADELLGSVFRNLLKNAIQHNDKDVPRIVVSGTEDPDEGLVRVRVADNGPGVPDGRKRDIFGKGEKGLESAGTGIGLYLVRSLVESYGGAVWVEDRAVEAADGADAAADGGESDDVGGAVFVVELPRAE